MIDKLPLSLVRLGPEGVRLLEEHLQACSQDYYSPLEERVDLNQYAIKLLNMGSNWSVVDNTRGNVVANVTWYERTDTRDAYISNVSVSSSWRGKGVALFIFEKAVSELSLRGFFKLELTTGTFDFRAQKFYSRFGFLEVPDCSSDGTIRMRLELVR